MLRRPKHSKIEVVAPKEKEEEEEGLLMVESIEPACVLCTLIALVNMLTEMFVCAEYHRAGCPTHSSTQYHSTMSHTQFHTISQHDVPHTVSHNITAR
jgi:hypothetical protein